MAVRNSRYSSRRHRAISVLPDVPQRRLCGAEKYLSALAVACMYDASNDLQLISRLMFLGRYCCSYVQLYIAWHSGIESTFWIVQATMARFSHEKLSANCAYLDIDDRQSFVTSQRAWTHRVPEMTALFRQRSHRTAYLSS